MRRFLDLWQLKELGETENGKVRIEDRVGGDERRKFQNGKNGVHPGTFS